MNKEALTPMVHKLSCYNLQLYNVMQLPQSIGKFEINHIYVKKTMWGNSGVKRTNLLHRAYVFSTT